MKEVISQINALLIAEAEPAYRQNIQTFVPSNRTVIGVRVPAIRKLAQKYHKNHPLDYHEAIKLLDQLFERGIREEILFGVFHLTKKSRQFDLALFAKIDSWVDQIENWEVCDQLATNIAGAIVAKNLSLVDDLVAWAQADNFWRRRFALATTVSLNQKGRVHVEETLRVCDQIMTDEEDMAVKAAGWALREAGDHDPEQLFAYLQKWRDKANPKIIRGGAEKLPADMKARLLS